MASRGTIFIISSPSGGGKSTLIQRVLEDMEGLVLAVSHTSRPPRKGEKEGVDYHFVAYGDFRKMQQKGEFVEHVRLHGQFYGTSRKVLDGLLAEGKDILLDIDVRGAVNVLALYPDAVSIFILPPSLPELEARLRKRGSDSAAQISIRLTAALREMRAASKYRYCIVNRSLERAAAELEAIITAERLHLSPKALKALLADISSQSK